MRQRTDNVTLLKHDLMPTLIIDSEESRRDSVWILDLHHRPHICGPISTPPAGVFIWALPSTVFFASLTIESRRQVPLA